MDTNFTTSRNMDHSESNTTTTVTITIMEATPEFVPLVGYGGYKWEEVVSERGTRVLTKFFEPGPGAVRCYEQWVFIPTLGAVLRDWSWCLRGICVGVLGGFRGFIVTLIPALTSSIFLCSL